MKRDVDFKKFYKEEELKSKRRFKRPECGEIKIMTGNVFITINYKEEKKEEEEC